MKEIIVKKHDPNKFQLGESVLVIAKNKPQDGSWNSIWNKENDDCVGKRFTIVEKSESLGFGLKHNSRIVYFPSYCLKL